VVLDLALDGPINAAPIFPGDLKKEPGTSPRQAMNYIGFDGRDDWVAAKSRDMRDWN
jgi:hypothetical protein